MSGRTSRRKGKSGELEVVHILHAAGLTEARRTPNSGGLAWRGDIAGVPGHIIEVKRCERLNVPAWLKQAYGDARGGEVPVVAFRRSASSSVERDPDTRWHVVVPLEEWARLVALSLAVVSTRDVTCQGGVT